MINNQFALAPDNDMQPTGTANLSRLRNFSLERPDKKMKLYKYILFQNFWKTSGCKFLLDICQDYPKTIFDDLLDDYCNLLEKEYIIDVIYEIDYTDDIDPKYIKNIYFRKPPLENNYGEIPIILLYRYLSQQNISEYILIELLEDIYESLQNIYKREEKSKNLIIYATNYNAIRIMSGMGGLRYSS